VEKVAGTSPKGDIIRILVEHSYTLHNSALIGEKTLFPRKIIVRGLNTRQRKGNRGLKEPLTKRHNRRGLFQQVVFREGEKWSPKEENSKIP